MYVPSIAKECGVKFKSSNDNNYIPSFQVVIWQLLYNYSRYMENVFFFLLGIAIIYSEVILLKFTVWYPWVVVRPYLFASKILLQFQYSLQQSTFPQFEWDLENE